MSQVCFVSHKLGILGGADFIWTAFFLCDLAGFI